MNKITIKQIHKFSTLIEPRAFTIKLISTTLGFDFFETSNTGSVVKEKEETSNLEKHTIVWYIKDLFNLKTNAMKKVSILSTLLLVMGFSTFFFISHVNAQSFTEKEKKSETSTASRQNYLKTKDKIEVAFTNELTFDSLSYIKDDLKTIGITITYKQLTFDDKNQLLSISCDIDCNDGFKGSFSVSSLNSINKNKRIGFYRDYSVNAKSPFGTGSVR